MKILSVQNVIENIQNMRESFGDKDNSDNCNSSEEELDEFTTYMLVIFIIILIIILILLYIWVGIVLLRFKLPPIILALAVICAILGNPLYAIILAYLFKDKTDLMLNKTGSLTAA
jgi:uncharacterized membrane protein